nr:VaFE repeat-containing surface-anchored protein [Granulicatella sp. 19428wC4_WM01]
MDKVNTHKQTTSWNGQSFTVKVGESITLTDEYNVVQNLVIPNEINGFTTTLNGNQLTVTATEHAENGELYFEQPINTGIHGPSIIYRADGSQTVAKLRIKDPQSATITLDVVKNGHVKVIKTDASSGHVLDGVEFGMFDDTDTLITKGVTNDKGEFVFTIEDTTKPFYIKETQAKQGYFLNEQRFDVTVTPGQTQTIEVTNEPIPTIVTEATTLSGGKIGDVFDTHREVATMTNLVVGQAYTVYATQYDTTGKAYARQEREFVAKETTHTETFEFSVPKGYIGDLVYGEELYRKDEQVAVHFDLANKKQTITVTEPRVTTEATSETGGKVVYTHEHIKEIADFDQLVIGQEYEVVANMFTGGGQLLGTQKRTFIAIDTTHQEVFYFDVPLGHYGDTVFGEELYHKGERVAVHFDLANKKQTVKVLEPKINTFAKIGGTKDMTVGEHKELVDTLTYTDFKHGKVLVRTWVVKYGTDEVVGEQVEQLLELDGNGEVSVRLDKIDTSKLPAGKYTIMEQVFEVIEHNGTVEKGHLISEHVDNTDENQSFTVRQPVLLYTGSEDSVLFTLIGFVSVLGGAWILHQKQNA